MPNASRSWDTDFDTDDGRLRRVGFWLRLRKSGGHFNLIVELVSGGIWTSNVPEYLADIGLLPPDAPRGEIGAILPEELRPCYIVDVTCRQKRLSLDGVSAIVKLNTGRITAADREAPVAEIEFGLLIGSPTIMLQEARALLGRYRLAVGASSHTARGEELLAGSPPSALKAVKPELAPSDSIEQAVAKIIAITTAQIIGNIAAAGDGRDPEGVHQLRVSLRRLRSAFALFRNHLSTGATALDSAARLALKSLSPARDIDVLLLETIPPVQDGDDGSRGLLRLAQIAESRRRIAYTDVRKLVQNRDFNRFLIDLQLAVAERGLVETGGADSLGPTAAALLDKRHRKALKTGRHFANLTYTQRHEVRIALKKLRYACDYFQSLFPGKATRVYLKSLARLQDDLGRLNDATVAEDLVDLLAEGDTTAATGAALVKGWYRHRLKAVEPKMLADWNRFTEARPFWKSEKNRD